MRFIFSYCSILFSFFFSRPRVKDGAPSKEVGQSQGPGGHGQPQADDGPRRRQPQALELPLEAWPLPQDRGRPCQGRQEGSMFDIC